MKTIRRFFWDVCDYANPRYMLIFVASAKILDILGDSYWVDSLDYSDFLRG